MLQELIDVSKMLTGICIARASLIFHNTIIEKRQRQEGGEAPKNPDD